MPTLFFSYLFNVKSMITRLTKQNNKSPNKANSRPTSVRGRGKTPIKNPSCNLSNTPFQPRTSLARTPPKVSGSVEEDQFNILETASLSQSLLDASDRNLLELSYTDLRFESDSALESLDCHYRGEMNSKGTEQQTSSAPSGAANFAHQGPPTIQQTVGPSSQQLQSNPPLPSTNITSAPTDISQIIDMLQRTIIPSQDEFRREITSIKGTIDTMCINSNQHILNSEHRNDRSDILNNSMNNNNYMANLPVHFKEWKVIFDGVGSVSDFLFKLDTLCIRNKCSHQQLMDNFHIFLTGRAETWYWFFIKQNPSASYPFLKFSITKEFGTLEKDHDIVIKISLKKQSPRESYDEFHSSIVAMNSRLGNPMSDIQLIDILKKNLNPGMKYILFNSNQTNLEDFREAARKAEKLLFENKQQFPLLPSQRHVNEIEAVGGTEEIDSDPQIEALQIKRRSDYSRILCWNCSSFGHSYIYCPEETRNLFCFKCGQRGFTTPKCPNRHMENGKPSEFTNGDSRSVK